MKNKVTALLESDPPSDRWPSTDRDKVYHNEPFSKTEEEGRYGYYIWSSAAAFLKAGVDSIILPLLPFYFYQSGYNALENGLLYSIRAISGALSYDAMYLCSRKHCVRKALALVGTSLVVASMAGLLFFVVHFPVLDTVEKSKMNQSSFTNSSEFYSSERQNTLPLRGFVVAAILTVLNSCSLGWMYGSIGKINHDTESLLLAFLVPIFAIIGQCLFAITPFPLAKAINEDIEWLLTVERTALIALLAFAVAAYLYVLVVMFKVDTILSRETRDVPISKIKYSLYLSALCFTGCSEGVAGAFAMWQILQLGGTYLACAAIYLTSSISSLIFRLLFSEPSLLFISEIFLLILCLPANSFWYFTMHLEGPIWLHIFSQLLNGFSTACIQGSIDGLGGRHGELYHAKVVEHAATARRTLGRGVGTLIFSIGLNYLNHKTIFLLASILYLWFSVIYGISFVLIKRTEDLHNKMHNLKDSMEVCELLDVLDQVETKKDGQFSEI